MSGTSRSYCLLLACSCSLFFAIVASAGLPEPYNEILRANADGTNLELVVPRERALAMGSIAIDPGPGPDPMFWPAWNPFEPGGFTPASDILRADLLGNGIRSIITHGFGPVQVDSGAARVFYTYRSDCQPCDALASANLDGSNIQQILGQDLVQVNAFDIDPAAEKIYWQGNDISLEPKMWVVDYDGTNVQELFPSGASAAIALDLTARKLYWTEFDGGKIRRANLDGSGIEDVRGGLDRPFGLVLEPASGQLWWSELFAGTVSRANLDGSGATEILVGLDSPRGLALLPTNDPGGGKVYLVTNPGALDVVVPAVSRAGAIVLILLLMTAATTWLLRRRTFTSDGG